MKPVHFCPGINIANTPFSEQFPLAQLHWIIADKDSSITVESMSDGLHIYDNPAGVLTNNPPFPQQMFQLNNYMHLSPKQPANTFSDDLGLAAYSRGMGALGLPGDLSSASRFVRVAFTKMNAKSGDSELESISQFSTSSALSISREAAVRSQMANTRSLSIRPAAILQREFTIILPTKIIRSVLLICTEKIWTVML